MIQGLVIRRVFVVVDLVLAGLVLSVAGLVVMKVFEEASNPFARNVAQVASVGHPGNVLHDVASRAEYDRILESHIFGPVGDETSASQEPPPPPPPTEAMEETKLNLVLRGTVATHSLDPLASATIENKDTKQTQVYGLSAEIVAEVFLEEVYPREVIILNKGKKEVLRMDEEEELSTLAKKPPFSRSSRPAPAGPPERFTLNQHEFIQQLYVNYADLVTKVKPRMYRDENGDIAGITASNLEDIPLAKTLDLHDGDVLQTINNEKIDSEEKIIKLINKNRDTKTFRIGILRNGRPLVRTYRLE